MIPVGWVNPASISAPSIGSKATHSEVLVEGSILESSPLGEVSKSGIP